MIQRPAVRLDYSHMPENHFEATWAQEIISVALLEAARTATDLWVIRHDSGCMAGMGSVASALESAAPCVSKTSCECAPTQRLLMEMLLDGVMCIRMGGAMGTRGAPSSIRWCLNLLLHQMPCSGIMWCIA